MTAIMAANNTHRPAHAMRYGSLMLPASALKSGILKPAPPPPRFFFEPGSRLISIMARSRSGLPEGEADRQHQQRHDFVHRQGFVEHAVLHPQVLDRVRAIDRDLET